MDEIEVEVVEAQVGERLAAGSDDVVLAVLVVPQLGGDPELFAFDSSAEDLLKGGADGAFVAVDGCAIEVPVAECGCAFDRIGHLAGADAIGSEGTQADSRHGRARRKPPFRNDRGID